MRRSFGAAFAGFLRRILAAPRLTDRYRPELHYMRGPGPKSRGRQRLQDAAGAEAIPALRSSGSEPKNFCAEV